MKIINNLDYCDYNEVQSMAAKKQDEDSPLQPFGTSKKKIKKIKFIKKYGRKN